MGYFDDIVSSHFCVAEDAIREPVAVISNAEGGEDISIPPQVVGDLGATYCHRVQTGSGVHGEDHSEFSLQGVGEFCPKNFGQSYSSNMGRDVGSSLPRRD